MNEREKKAAKVLQLFGTIAGRVEEARLKHPVFAEGAYHALGVIESEFHELEYAIEHESEQRQKDEALDVIATCIRFLCDEHKQEVVCESGKDR